MEGYLGTEVVDVKDTPYKDYTKEDWILHTIEDGFYDGAHHKQWAIDQTIRVIKNTPIIIEKASWENGHFEYRTHLGEPSEEYKKYVTEYENGEAEDENDIYEYDEGIAP